MTSQQLASKLTVWSKRKIPYQEALLLAQKYLANTLGEGIVKDYFNSLVGKACDVPGCTNTTSTKFCASCISLNPTSQASKTLLIIADLIQHRP